MHKAQIAIMDYQLSNLFSVKHVCDYYNLNAEITSDKNKIVSSQAVILPGVGAFGDAMNNLKKLGLVDVIKEFVNQGKPLMGVCLGMQLLFTKSEEFGVHEGLDIIKGEVMKFPSTNNHGEPIKIPHIGWNEIFYTENNSKKWLGSPLRSIKNHELMYFVHSYYVKPDNTNNILALTNYNGLNYCSSVSFNNVFAVQFHPEKSGVEGIKIYKDWSENIR